MKILAIPVKFQKGDTIYTTKQERVEITCHVCEGNGKIKYNNKDMKCPECMGVGKIKSNKNISVVCDDPFIITSTKVSIDSSGDISVRYKGRCNYVTLSRAEDNLFSTKEEAKIKCEEFNKEKVFIKIEDIIIKDCFRNTRPSLDKIQSKIEYYKGNSKFDKNIIINKDNVLQDGYINYLICRLLNIETIKVVIESCDELSELLILKPLGE